MHFAQPSARSKVLNRVVGRDPSAILGSLQSNGQVWLLNPYGVLFGAGARVDVAGLVATTLRARQRRWRGRPAEPGRQRGRRVGSAFGSVVNQGELRTASGGRVMLIGGAGGVRNEGLIDAPDGQVLLACRAQVDLVDTGTADAWACSCSAPQGEALNLGQLSGRRWPHRPAGRDGQPAGHRARRQSLGRPRWRDAW